MVDVPDRDRLAMVSELAQASGVAGMCGGQALICRPRDSRLIYRRWSVSIAINGVLIRAAVRMGALSAGERGRAAPSALDRYVKISVLPSRSVDDILDVVGDTADPWQTSGC